MTVDRMARKRLSVNGEQMANNRRRVLQGFVVKEQPSRIVVAISTQALDS